MKEKTAWLPMVKIKGKYYPDISGIRGTHKEAKERNRDKVIKCRVIYQDLNNKT